MKKPGNKELLESEEIKKKISILLKKYPNAYIPDYDPISGLPILPKSEYKDWEY